MFRNGFDFFWNQNDFRELVLNFAGKERSCPSDKVRISIIQLGVHFTEKRIFERLNISLVLKRIAGSDRNYTPNVKEIGETKQKRKQIQTRL